MSAPHSTATLTSKGQTTIPKAIREQLNMKSGDRMTFTLMPDSTVVIRLKRKKLADLAGILHKKNRKALSIAELSR
jgi:antitoxin PrlF